MAERMNLAQSVKILFYLFIFLIWIQILSCFFFPSSSHFSFPPSQTHRQMDERPSLHAKIIASQTQECCLTYFQMPPLATMIYIYRRYLRLLPFHIPCLPNRCGTPAPLPPPKSQSSKFPKAAQSLDHKKKQGQCLRRWGSGANYLAIKGFMYHLRRALPIFFRW